MSKNNVLDLDGHVLTTFLAILEHSSVTAAADELGVTQSAVSHTLARLRNILGDRLFVRSGHKLTPTEMALSLKVPVRKALDIISGLTDERFFDPKQENMRFVVAANDMQRDLIFPQLIKEAWAEGIPLEFEFMPSGQPTVGLMRDARCQLALTPLPPDGPDIFQKALFSSDMMCFYDSEMRDPPLTWEEYRDADHLTVRFSGGGTSLRVVPEIDGAQLSPPKISVSNFNAISAFTHGTQLIATEMEMMKIHTLSTLDMAPLPFKTTTITIYLVWHERSTNDPAHKWLRDRIAKIANEVAAEFSNA
jgi:DNA-binding transcriptional LysR family regulator